MPSFGLTILQYKFHALHSYVCTFSESFFFFFCLFSCHTPVITTAVPLFFLLLFLLHAAYSCMTLSLGLVIQVLLSCLLHSTQSIYTSSIRPHATLFCRYSTEHKQEVWVYVGSDLKHLFDTSCIVTVP